MTEGLTKNKHVCFFDEAGRIDGESIDNALAKLEKLEDIEDELGVGIVTLYKAKKNGVYFLESYYDEDGSFIKNIFFINNDEVSINFDLHLICWVVRGRTAQSNEFDDYGKTWALTKRELEK